MSFKVEESLGHKILDSQFNFIASCINDSGQMVDKKLKSSLEFQYQYTAFMVSCVLKNNNKYLSKILKYYLDIPGEKKRPSNEFNVFLLLLALDNDRNNLLIKYKEDIFKSIYHKSDKELYELNNNFRALRLVGLILEDKLTCSNKNKQKIEQETNWILNLQFYDGFFPDSNMQYKFENNRGIPHLVYHTKITMCVGMAYKYTNNTKFLNVFNRALTSLLDISTENYYFFYGRSTNSLFGYGSLYLVLVLAYKFNDDKKYLTLADGILGYLKYFQHCDGHISINLNQDDSKRPGFDAYMYDLVYNSYSNAMFLYANYLKNCAEVDEGKAEYGQAKKILVYKDSGFVVYKDQNINYCFNFKGHQDSLKHRFDSRVSPFSLLYFFNNKKNMLPAVVYKPSGISSLVKEKFYFKKIHAKYYHFINYYWMPIFSGNSFFYDRNGIKFYPFRCIKALLLRDILILKFKSVSRKIFGKTEVFDKFVVSIKLSKGLKYRIIFYNQVDTLFYAYREISGENFFEYKFSKKFKKLKTLAVETSCKKASLYRYKFQYIKKLEIEVKISDG